MNPSPLENKIGQCVVEYDFAKDGGAIGSITLRGPDIPSGAIVDFGLIDVVTACTSGGSATLALTLVSAGDIKAADAVANWTLAATLATVPVGTAATAVKTTARKKLVLTIAVAALTAGKFRVALRYMKTR